MGPGVPLTRSRAFTRLLTHLAPDVVHVHGLGFPREVRDLRAMAPRSGAMAGFAAGLLAGGFGAAIYSFYCGETGMMFMAVWYSLGVAATAVLGALLGRLLLRW